MALELDPQSIGEALKRAAGWLRANPIVAVMGGGLVLIVILFVAVIASVTHNNVAPEKVHIAEDDANLCVRVQKLLKLESSAEKRGMSGEYQVALQRVFKELLGEEGSPDDLAQLSENALRCNGASNEDFAWQVALDARLKRGAWPDKLTAPPSNPDLRTHLAQALDKYTALHPALPADPAARDAWLRFAALAQPPQKTILAMFSKGTPDEDVQLYQALIRVAPDSPVVGDIYGKLGLLSQPIYVADTSGSAGVQPASMPMGVDDTLPFLGVISGEQCALAGDKRAHPALILRSCNGLVPRRLPQGEVILVGTPTHFDRDESLRWLPIVLGDDGAVKIGEAGKVSEKLLAAFVTAAPHFTADGKPFTGDLAPVAADNKPLTFRSPEQKMVPVILFSQKAPVKVDKACPKLEKNRCESHKDEDGTIDKCEVAAPICLTLGNGQMLRVARALNIHTEGCIKEYGEKNSCEHHDTYSLFVDVRAKGEKAFTDGTALPIAETPPKTDN